MAQNKYFCHKFDLELSVYSSENWVLKKLEFIVYF